jgi:hypothetical protein
MPHGKSRRRRATFEALKAEALRLGFSGLGVWQLSFSRSTAVCFGGGGDRDRQPMVMVCTHTRKEFIVIFFLLLCAFS